MKIKRAPLLGGIGILLIIILLSTTIIYKKENTELRKINNSVNTTINEQTDKINDLEVKVSELEKENEQLRPKSNTKKSTEQSNTSTKSEATQEKTISSEGKNLGQFKITAYCNCSKCCGQWAGGPTAYGTMPAEGRTIAVDPNVIPLGSKVVIDGHTYVAEDTGSAIKGNKIDMYFNSHSDAMAWGVKHKNVSIAG